ncbi:MAG: hypothetical protein JJE03_07745 [Peptostreptococcaceae bacterium]|nr:hypothetical protein [Peptostreptococcaceae bacterium]
MQQIELMLLVIGIWVVAVMLLLQPNKTITTYYKSKYDKTLKENKDSKRIVKDLKKIIKEMEEE